MSADRKSEDWLTVTPLKAGSDIISPYSETKMDRPQLTLS